jgi:co-chaperonin GroES (HSP10)
MFKKLLGNKVLVEKEQEEKQEEKKTAAGIVIPPSQNQQQSLHAQGKVVQAGPECEVVSEGDVVMYDKMAIRPLEIGDTEYVLLNEESIVGVL